MAIEKFTINIPDAVLTDLKHRLDATRWPDELENVGWEYGSSLSYMKSLAEYWRNGYDWRQQESTLNQLPQYRVALDGFHVHFVHVRSKHPKSLPLLITHGWPGAPHLDFEMWASANQTTVSAGAAPRRIVQSYAFTTLG